MTKQLNIKIEKCEDCPYYRMTYNQAPGGRWEDKSEFICKLANKHMRGSKSNLHENCPLDDERTDA